MAFPRVFSACLLLLLGGIVSTAYAASSYSERLYLRPLPQSGLFASFDFHSNASLSSFVEQDFRFLPRSLSQILQYSHTKELHLRFGSGRWDEELWGPLPVHGARVGGTGVELWAWVEADSKEEAYDHWLTLTNTLSGLFCASLNFIDATRTIRPVAVFPPEGTLGNSTSTLHLLHGQLAREVVCTENLTPFLKLMQCKGKAGISSLFDGHKLFDSAWQSMSVDIKPVCPSDGGECAVEFHQMIGMVLDVERSKRPRGKPDDPIPRPVDMGQLTCDQTKFYSKYGDACFPAPSDTLAGFKVSEVFGRPLKGSCPLSEINGEIPAALCLDTSASPTVHPFPEGGYHTEEVDEHTKCWRMPVRSEFDLAIEPQASSFLPLPLPPPIKVYRSFSGRGQECGGSSTVFTNPSPHHPVELIYLESLPWFIKPYLHTLTVDHRNSASLTKRAPDLLKKLHYVPAVDRHRGTHLELSLTVPAASTLTIAYDFDKTILRYTEYPPDPNRGFDVPPAVVRVLPSSYADPNTGATIQTPEYHMRTMSLLVYLPTPDFSMPYNVIILTSTVVALAFGSIFNIIVRRFVAADEVQGLAGGVLAVAIRRGMDRIKAALRVKGKTE